MEHVDYCPDCQRRVEQVESADPLDQQLAKLRDHQPQRTDAIFLNRWHRSAAGRHKSFTLPTEIGPYRLLRTIASGGMGTVYDARHRRLGRPFAFKLLHVGGRISRGEAQRIKSEWRTHGRLSHPNIVAATDAGVVDGQPYLVTERVEGIDLSSLVRSQGPLTPADACELIRQAATGLQYVHDQQIVHGDVKPSNLMLSTGGVVKLLDLGTAKQLDVAGFDGLERATTHGTLAYMAPEQLTHRESAVSGGASPENYRSDIYSLGCTLYFLLTSQPPFGNQQESSNQELIEAHRSQPPPQIVGLASDDPLHRLLDRTLAKDPADRPQSMQELIEELEPLSRGHDVAELLSGWRTERIDQVETDASLFELTHGLTALLKIHRRRFPWSIVAAALLVIGGAVWWMTRDAIVGDTTSVATAEPSVGDAASIAVAAQPYTARTSYGEDILNFDTTWKPSPRSGTLDEARRY